MLLLKVSLKDFSEADDMADKLESSPPPTPALKRSTEVRPALPPVPGMSVRRRDLFTPPSRRERENIKKPATPQDQLRKNPDYRDQAPVSKEKKSRGRRRLLQLGLLTTAAVLGTGFGAKELFRKFGGQVSSDEDVAPEVAPMATPAPPPKDSLPQEVVAPPVNEIRKELPKDVISPEVLASKYGARIWSQPHFKLHLRESVLEREKYFSEKHYQTIVEGKNYGINKLDIVIFNGPISYANMTEEQKKALPDLVATLKKWDEEWRASQTKEFNDPKIRKEKRAEYDRLKERMLDSSRRTGSETPELNEQLRKLEDAYWPYLYTARPKDIEPYKHSANGVRATGGPRVYKRSVKVNGVDSIEIEKVEPGESYLLLPAPSAEALSYSNPKALKQLQSFMSPDNFKINSDDQEYPVGLKDNSGVDPFIFKLRHELKHLAGRRHPFADLETLEDIGQANEDYVKNGDDTGYYGVVETPLGVIYI